MTKHLNVGMVGYGFMGRTHSNGYKRVGDFFDLESRPVLKAVCGRSADAAQAFAEWKVPEKYKGYAAMLNAQSAAAYAQVVMDETK